MNKNERPLSGPGTIVGTNAFLTGTLKDSGDITIHGTIEGETISERSIVIGETAQIKGPVTGQIITLAGTVRGSIDAGQKLEILPTGKVFGSISTRELVIRAGAIFIGKSTMPVEEEIAQNNFQDEGEEGSEPSRAFETASHLGDEAEEEE